MLREVVNYQTFDYGKFWSSYEDKKKLLECNGERENIIILFNPVLTDILSKYKGQLWNHGGKYYKYKAIAFITKPRLDLSETNPQLLGKDPQIKAKQFWIYKDKIYWENDGLDAESVKALADSRESKKQRKVEFLKGPDKKQKSRRYIENDVKVAVWRRDNARCVKCGSNEDLEFDHIIPVSMGGSSTERNLQLLCERCNREKGADLK